jgi:Cu(I)/Ag(I) efflux system membrane fusion protein
VRKIVFVEGAPGRFEPREVEAGERTGGRMAIRSGVAEGEKVAVRANFLLDAESRLRASLGASRSGSEAPAAEPHAEHR